MLRDQDTQLLVLQDTILLVLGQVLVLNALRVITAQLVVVLKQYAQMVTTRLQEVMCVKNVLEGIIVPLEVKQVVVQVTTVLKEVQQKPHVQLDIIVSQVRQQQLHAQQEQSEHQLEQVYYLSA